MEEKPLKKRRNLASSLDQQVDQIVYKIMTNEGLEDTIVRAIQRALVDLVKRYFLLIVVLVIFALGFQSYLLTIILKNN